TSTAASTAARIRAAAPSASASSPRSNREPTRSETMTIFRKHRVLCGTALTVAAAVVTWGCKDLLESAATPQGALNESTLANATGVEGSLIASYRALDCTDSNFAFGGCSASNWGLGSVPSDDAYKGSEAQDFPDMTDVE